MHPGLVVLLKDDRHPLQWQLGVTDQTFAGDDGLIRVATVRTRRGTFKGPTHNSVVQHPCV
jgi:hypothetical protein